MKKNSKIHSNHGLCSKEDMQGEEGRMVQVLVLIHLMLSRATTFCSSKSWAEEKSRHKEQTGLSAGPSLCHCRLQAAEQSCQLPGHLVRPLPAAPAWHRVDCSPPAAASSSLWWSFNHREIHTQNVGLLSINEEKYSEIQHLLYTRLRSFFWANLFINICWDDKVHPLKLSPKNTYKNSYSQGLTDVSDVTTEWQPITHCA